MATKENEFAKHTHDNIEEDTDMQREDRDRPTFHKHFLVLEQRLVDVLDGVGGHEHHLDRHRKREGQREGKRDTDRQSERDRAREIVGVRVRRETQQQI